MKRLLLYMAIMAAVLLIPVERADVAKLHPVQTVALYKITEGYRIETDTGDIGSGATVDAAFADLKATTPGVIYLDTADYFLIAQDTESAAEEMRKYLKSGVQVCEIIGQGNLENISLFLSSHSGLPLFRKWEKGENLPLLDCRKEQIKFLQKNEKNT